jgi:hypothetical protein
MGRIARLLALGLVLECLACSPFVDAESGADGSRADSEFTDWGPIEWGRATLDPTGKKRTVSGETPLKPFGRKPIATYVETFGPVTLTFTAPGAQLELRGRFERAGGKLLGQELVAGTGGLKRDLQEPGVYQVQVTTAGPVTLASTCEGDGCRRPLETSVALVQRLRKSGKLSRAAIRDTLEELHVKSDAAGALSLLAFPLTSGFFSVDQFPKFALDSLDVLVRSLSGLGQRPKPDQRIESDLLGLPAEWKCEDAEEAQKPPQPLGQFEGLSWGFLANKTVSGCMRAQSQGLATFLNSLAAYELDGPVVVYKRGSYHSARELILALIESGHTVEMRSERYYPPFIEFVSRNGNVDSEVPWYIWLDTKLALGGGTAVVPAGHSQFAWHIHGPDLNARVVFQHDVRGLKFSAKSDEWPEWTGGRAVRRESSDADEAARARVLLSFDVAAKWLRRNRVERGELPGDGYGRVGACNDTTGVLEIAVWGETTAFPTLRRRGMPRLDDKLHDGLDDLLENKLPHDSFDAKAAATAIAAAQAAAKDNGGHVDLAAVDTWSGNSAALKRLAQMTPYESPEAEPLLPPSLRKTLKALADIAR